MYTTFRKKDLYQVVLHRPVEPAMATGMRKLVTGILGVPRIRRCDWGFLTKERRQECLRYQSRPSIGWGCFCNRVCAILDGNWRERAALRFVDYPQTAC